MAKQTSNLPSIKDIVKDLDGYKKQDDLNVLLSQQPPASWVKEHPFIKVDSIDANGRKVKVPYQYLPIDKVEYLLKRIFKKHKIEVLREGTMFNAVYTAVRIHYLDLITNEWMYHDGVGAYALQTKKDTSPSDMSNINHGAVMMALPLSKTLAVKDACDMFGDLFGANLNRRDTLQVSQDKGLRSEDEQLDELTALKDEVVELKLMKDGDSDLDALNRIMEEQESVSYAKAIRVLKQKLKENK